MDTMLWLRRDLRRHDLPALNAAHQAAKESGGQVHVVFVVDPHLWSTSQVRTAWLAATLRATQELYDGRLSIRHGDPATLIPRLAKERGVGAVHVSAETTPYGRERDEAVSKALEKSDMEWVETGSPYAVTPGRITKDDGTPYRVFTPFSRAWREHGWHSPAKAVRSLDLAPADDDKRVAAMLDKALRECPIDLPTAGQDAAERRWRAFRDDALGDYDGDRDRPAVAGTSFLSPYLKVGAIHPRTILADLTDRRGSGPSTYETEICWRDFYGDVLWHQPSSAWEDYRSLGISYNRPHDDFTAWQEGRTGFPIVDAGMRQLLETGWMHNRVRMITASFLTKDLHAWWPSGARHFLDRLIDGDLASNNHGWQWTAGTGTDAAPYFRVFNPITQGLKFDPQGDYVRRWVPELEHVPGKAAHEPWDHDEGYDHGYPQRIVDHAEERKTALDRYQRAKR